MGNGLAGQFSHPIQLVDRRHYAAIELTDRIRPNFAEPPPNSVRTGSYRLRSALRKSQSQPQKTDGLRPKAAL
jgi:hypothetical protein